MQEVKIPNFLKDFAIPEREIPIMAVEKPIEEVEQKRIEELQRANTEELVRLFGNLSIEEKAAVLHGIDDDNLLLSELQYRVSMKNITIDGFCEIADRYRNLRR